MSLCQGILWMLLEKSIKMVGHVLIEMEDLYHVGKKEYVWCKTNLSLRTIKKAPYKRELPTQTYLTDVILVKKVTLQDREYSLWVERMLFAGQKEPTEIPRKHIP